MHVTQRLVRRPAFTVTVLAALLWAGVLAPRGADAEAGSGRGDSTGDEIIAEATVTRPADDDEGDEGSRRPACRWRAKQAMNALTGRTERITRVRAGQTWVLGVRECAGPPMTRTRLWVREPRTGAGSGDSRAASRRLPPPAAATAPSADRVVVNSPMWFWVVRRQWRPVSVTVTVPLPSGAFSVTTTATPMRLEFDPGDGSPVRRCDGPGNPWSTALGDGSRSDCMHTYARASHGQPTGAWNARLTTVWSVRWRASNGTSGRAPDARTHSPLRIVVREIQAVGRR